MRKKIVVVTAALAVGAGATVGVAPEAEAAYSRVCHQGDRIDPPVEVFEKFGSTYKIFPGDCTPLDPGVEGFRPLHGTKIAWKVGKNGKLKVSVPATGWIGAAGKNVIITNVAYAG